MEVLNDGIIASKRNINLSGRIINLSTITDDDKIDIVDFGLKYKIDFIAISFIRYESYLKTLANISATKTPNMD